jgi:polyphosphate kinase
VRSILGRFLEHSRIFRFGKPGRGARYFIGSADLMNRNLERRVETLVQIDDPALQERLEEILAVNLAANPNAWTLDSDGAWTRMSAPGERASQERFQELARERSSPS